MLTFIRKLSPDDWSFPETTVHIPITEPNGGISQGGWDKGQRLSGFRLLFFVAEPSMQSKIQAVLRHSSYCLHTALWLSQSRTFSFMPIELDA
jgi:hypothetical protein